MPLIVHILEEDLAGWELSHRGRMVSPPGGWSHHYRPRDLAGEEYEQVQVISPAPLEELVDQDLLCHINIEKGWMSKQVGAHPEVKFQLRRLTRLLEGTPRRLRLRIRSIDASSRPPRVELEEFNG
ncbi:MAG TPA: hypothetical protein VKW06_00715 [Candidatus Angelobacter sp.]|nr:hypothetical protein [Candidatus Angelobacter sp.]